MANVYLYALSTCIHCKNTKQFLDEKSIDYDFVYVDKLTGEEREKTIEEVRNTIQSSLFPPLWLMETR